MESGLQEIMILCSYLSSKIVNPKTKKPYLNFSRKATESISLASLPTLIFLIFQMLVCWISARLLNGSRPILRDSVAIQAEFPSLANPPVPDLLTFTPTPGQPKRIQ
jgi:hypothetical protein